MKYEWKEWIDVNKEKPPVDKIFKGKFKVDIPGYNICVGDIKQTKLIFSEAAGGLVLKLNVEDDYDGFGILEDDISHWLKTVYKSIDNRFEILDL